MSKTSPMPFDLKEDLRLRMMDLEKKLAESEEERIKMEKTCNALMRSFREQGISVTEPEKINLIHRERMRYIALNRKYEKFLQDCTVRKRRNEIILRSLCRIEDRSKALFAKTERLKLLKDRHISHLKMNDIKKGNISSQFSSLPQNNVDVISKSVHWKTPLASDQKKKNLEVENGFYNRTSDIVFGVSISGFTSLEKDRYGRSEKVQGYEGRKNSERTVINETVNIKVPQNKLNLVKIGSDFCESLAEPDSIPFKSEKLFRNNNQRKSENDCFSKHEPSKGKFNDKNFLEISERVTSHQESVEKVEKDLLLNEEYSDDENSDSDDGKILRKNDTETSEKDSPLQDELLPTINNHFVAFRSSNTPHDKANHENIVENAGKEIKTQYEKEETSKSLPMGLDGIDYQNETYPESYYEQPVYHHSHTNIAADVILEEDETEQDGEEEEKEMENVAADHNSGKTQISRKDSYKSGIWVHSPRNRILNESNLKSATDEGYPTDANRFDEPFSQIKSQKSDSEKSSEAERSDLADEPKGNKNESLFPDKSDKNKPPVKSNLIQLLESDSESYQIEHGDGVSENEVSDFDLSFH